MNHFLSCDWGTTSFRLRLADGQTGEILAEEHSREGIAQTFDRWQQNLNPGINRVDFYLGVINRHIKKLEEGLGQSLAGTKIIISGMA